VVLLSPACHVTGTVDRPLCRSTPHFSLPVRRCLFHCQLTRVSLSRGFADLENAMSGKPDVEGVNRKVLDQPRSSSSAEAVVASSPLSNSPKQTIRRPELRKIVPLADTTIYEMEQRGEFPRRFHLTSRCVVWELAEVEAWIEERRRASDAAMIKRAPSPDVRQRKTRPVRH